MGGEGATSPAEVPVTGREDNKGWLGQRRCNFALEHAGFEVVFLCVPPQSMSQVGSEFHSSAAEEEVWAGNDSADQKCGWSGCCLGRGMEQAGQPGLSVILRNCYHSASKRRMI